MALVQKSTYRGQAGAAPNLESLCLVFTRWGYACSSCDQRASCRWGVRHLH
jgi:hypothetical protein